jgi:hypothetical protein
VRLSFIAELLNQGILMLLFRLRLTFRLELIVARHAQVLVGPELVALNSVYRLMASGAFGLHILVLVL